MISQAFFKRLCRLIPLLLCSYWVCPQSYAVAPIPKVPCSTQPVRRGPGNDDLHRFKGDGSDWSFVLQPEPDVTISNQVWTYPGKGEGVASQWGQWTGGDGTNELKWSSPLTAQPFVVKVKATRSCANTGGLGGGALQDSEFEVSWSGDVKNILVEFSPTPVGICMPGQSSSLIATITPPEAAGEVTFDTLSPTVATIAGTAPTLTVTGVGTGQTKVRALDGNMNVIAVADVNVGDNTTFSPADVTVREVPASDSAINGLHTNGYWGFTWPKDLNIEITACLKDDGGWHAIVTGMSATYSIQTVELWKMITGPNGAPPGTTTATNFCKQVEGLNNGGFLIPDAARVLGDFRRSEWNATGPLRLHEEVHAAHLPSIMQELAVFTEPEVEQIVIANAPGMTQSQAISLMQPQLQGIRKRRYDDLVDRLGELGAIDHGTHDTPGPAFVTQFAAEQALEKTICDYAAQQDPAWPDCSECHAH